MGTDSKIQWTHHTFNPWIGCAKVSEGCKNCYAEALARARPALVHGAGPHPVPEGHKLVVWGDSAPRRVTSTANWKQPLRWNRAAEKAGERRRVFCASLADVFEDNRPLSGDTRCWEDLDDAREALWPLIEQCTGLDWLLLTKRPENVLQMVPHTWLFLASQQTQAALMRGETPIEHGRWPRHVWIGFTGENQQRFDERWAHARKIPAPVIFASIEPQIGPVVLPADFLARGQRSWAITGGESGGHARPLEVGWMRSIVKQCHAARVPVFCKQVGANVRDRNDAGFEAENEVWADGPDAGRPTEPRAWPTPQDIEHSPDGVLEEYQGAPVRVRLRDRKGGDMHEWPEDLRVREWPEARP